MEAKKPKGFGKFDRLMKKLVKVKMPSPCCGVESTVSEGRHGWRCGQCGRKWEAN